MDLETFLTLLYVWVDDWYKFEGASLMRRHAGPALQMSDSEVLTVALAGQWRVGVPWQSERGVVRYMQKHGRGWFPTMLQRSAFNQRVRQIWGCFVRLQQVVGRWLETAETAYACVDSVPLPACSLAQALKGNSHWLWWSSKGHGGTQGGWFFGEQLLLAVHQHQAITGWLVGPAHSDDRWMMQALVSTRAGRMTLLAPAPDRRQKVAPQVPPPGSILPMCAANAGHPYPYLADRGFNGTRWHRHWAQWHAVVLSQPPDNAPDAWEVRHARGLRSRRQLVETIAARLVDVFGLHRLQAHSRWGQLTRIAAKCAAYNLGVWLNRQLGRPDGALATLIC
jgi:hypothetical protein